MSDVDKMDEEFQAACAADWSDAQGTADGVAILMKHVAIWRSRANYYRGRLEGQAETIAYLKARIRTLETEDETEYSAAEVPDAQ